MDIGNVLRPTVASKIHNNLKSRNEIIENFAIILISINLHKKNCIALYFSKFGI